MKHGADQLKEWMARRGLNLQDTADLLGWDQTFVSKILNRWRTPGRSNAIHLEDVAGISVRSWESSERDKGEREVAVASKKRK